MDALLETLNIIWQTIAICLKATVISFFFIYLPIKVLIWMPEIVDAYKRRKQNN